MGNLVLNPSSLTLGSLGGYTLSGAEKKFLSLKQPAGVTLFSRNIENPCETESLSLLKELQVLSASKKLPFISAIDQEGGRVARLKHPDLDTGRAFSLVAGRFNKSALRAIKEKACLQGKALLKLGFNVNFAPVVDITYPIERHSECSTQDRAFGSNRESVFLRASAFLEGLEGADVWGCLKHYPGIGKIEADTHHRSAWSNISEKTLWEENLFPFRKLKGKAELIMVAHSIFPKICSFEASRSSILMTDILRGKLGYEGLILSDDLTMDAVNKSETSWKEYVVASVAAGCDLLLICSGLDRWQMACDVLELETKKSTAFRKRVEESCVRIQKFRQKLSLC